jgi:hypothetical protein
MTIPMSCDGKHQEQSTQDLVMHHRLHIDIHIMNPALKARAQPGAAN